MSKLPILEICSVDIAIPDLIVAEHFYTTVWGLEVAARQDNKVYLRATGRDPHVLVLHPGAAAAVLSVTFRTSSLDDLPRLTAAVSAAGGSVIHDIAPVEEPGGGTAVTVETPEGYVLRFLHGDIVNASGGPRKDFPFRLSHVNLNCADIASTRSLLRRSTRIQTDRSLQGDGFSALQ